VDSLNDGYGWVFTEEDLEIVFGRLTPCFSEPTSAWRYAARQFEALLTIVFRLRQGEPTRAQDWQAIDFRWVQNRLPWLRSQTPGYAVKEFTQMDLNSEAGTEVWCLVDTGIDGAVDMSSSVQKSYVVEILNGLIEYAGLAPVANWSALDRLPAVRLEIGWSIPSYRENCRGAHTPLLFSVLVAQLIAALTSDSEWHVCSVCRRPYQHDNPGYKLRSGVKPLCPVHKQQARDEQKRASARRAYANKGKN
jgi:hypothetical protein